MEPRTEQPAPKSVLVVDDDPKSLRILEVSLRSEGFDVQVAADAAAATAWLETNVPGVVIAATGQAGIDGFEFCRRLKEKPAFASVPFMLIGEATAANKIRGIEIGAEEFVGKPVFVKDVVGRVSLLMQRQTRQRMETDAAGELGFSGTLADISVVDLIQTLQGHRRSGVIHLRSQQSGNGEIYFRQGAVVDAEVGRLSGREAMFRLFSWSQGSYRIEPKSIRRKDAVGLAPAALVMEGMRRLDDWQRLLKDLPPLQTVFEVDYRVLAERLAEIPDEVNGILRLFDGARTLLNVVDDCGIADAEALSLAGKLYAEGIIRDVQAPAEELASDSSPAAEGWLTEAAGPFRPPTASDETDASAVDRDDIHRRRTGPMEPLESEAPHDGHGEDQSHERNSFERDTALQPIVLEPEEPAEPTLFAALAADESASAASESAPSVATAVAEPPEEPSSITLAEPVLSAEPAPEPGPPVAVSSSAIPDLREDESARVIPFADPGAGDVRRTLLAAGGIPDGGVATENGALAAIAGSLGEGTSTSSRSTEPGIGPPVEPAVLLDTGAAEAVLAAAAPPPAEASPAAPAGRAVPREQSEDEVSSSEALDELNLPSRHRGPLMLLGGAALIGGLIFAAQRWFLHAEPAPVAAHAASTEKAAPAAEPPHETAVATAVKPTEPPSRTAAPDAAEKTAAPAVELPAAPPSEAHREPAKEPPPKEAPGVSKTETPYKTESPPAPAVAKSPSSSAKAVATAGGEASRSGDFPALMDRCRSAFAQGKMREAATACAAAKDANAESGDALLVLAHVEFNRNHLKEALQWAEKAIKADPNLADAYVIFGGVQQDAGRNREAKWAYKKYLELAPRGQYAADLRAIVDTL